MGVFGTTSAAIAAGGSTPSVVASTESWNGTAWTETNDLNTARIDMGTAGNHDEGIVFGGTPPGYLAITESWNGFTWTEQADLATGRYSLGGAGSGSAALAVGGGSATDTNTAATEEWTIPSAPLAQLGQVWFNEASTTLKGFAAQGTGTWAAGGAINTARLYLAGAGTSQYASMIFGGAVPGTQDITETYNGTAWTEVADLNTAREQFAGLSAGSITATATVGGVSSASPVVIDITTEEWNGSSWTDGNDLQYPAYKTQGAGTLTSGLAFGGGSHPWAILDESATYNGTTWSDAPDLQVAKVSAAGFGASSSDGLCIAGENPSTGYSVTCEQFNGTAWAEVADANTGRKNCGGRGANSTQGFIVGGEIGGPTYASQVKTEFWNGTAWTEVADIAAVSTGGSSGGGTETSAVYSGGNNGTAVVAFTDEWVLPGVVKTLTVS